MIVQCSTGNTCAYFCAPYPTGGTYLDCDGDPTNGCEASPNATKTCGVCGKNCGGDGGANQQCAISGVDVGDCATNAKSCLAGGPFGFYCAGTG
jgi:hypothetical protein